MLVVGSGLALNLFYFPSPLFRRTIIILRLVFTVSLYLPCNVLISSSENTRHVSTARHGKRLVGSGKTARQLKTNPTYFVIKWSAAHMNFAWSGWGEKGRSGWKTGVNLPSPLPFGTWHLRRWRGGGHGELRRWLSHPGTTFKGFHPPSSFWPLREQILIRLHHRSDVLSN